MLEFIELCREKGISLTLIFNGNQPLLEVDNEQQYLLDPAPPLEGKKFLDDFHEFRAMVRGN
jgi:hypothetical protein